MKMKIIDSSTVIEEILMDNKLGKPGRQITEIYNKSIKAQNELIKEITENLNNNIEIIKTSNKENSDIKIKEINYLLERLKENHSINIQKATENELINLEEINVESYKSFESLIYAFSKRKCFNSNNLSLNYNEYDQLEINYELIEKYLTKCLLYKKKSFTKELRFINYKLESSDESFSSNLNQLISTFGYTQLSNEKTEKILNYDNLSLILSSLDQLIFYINNNKYDENSNISDVLKNANSVMNLNDCSKLINENGIAINELPSLYDYIEEKIFPSIKQNIKNQIINNELNNKFKNVDKIFDDNNEYINKNNLLRALRKFSIKYLLNDDNSIKYEEKLFDYLQREQGLWLYDKEKNDNIIKLRDNDFKKLNDLFVEQPILVKHTIWFYNILNGEEMNKKNNENQNII